MKSEPNYLYPLLYFYIFYIFNVIDNFTLSKIK